MNILYVITGLGGGGAEKVVVDLADQMFKRGHQVKIAYLKGQITVYPEQSEIDLVYLGLESIFGARKAYESYKKLLLDFQPDVVHAHMVHANLFARISRAFFSVPKLICTAHNANEGGKIRMLGYKFTNRFSDINTNVSVEAVETFVQKKAFNESALAIYNGIDLKKFKFLEKDRGAVLNILAVGRLTEQKDYPNLLKAISLLGDQNIVHVKIAGDGEERNTIRRLISKYNLESNVELLGRREDIPKLLEKADLFVLSSLYEGFGLVVAEAMACNTFVVGTDCGGVKEVMGDTGILVPPKDSVALSLALTKAIQMSKEDIIQNNIKALEHVNKNFDLQIIVDKWLKLYAS